MESLYKELLNLRTTYGDIYSLRFMFTDVIVLNGPEIIKEALITHAEDFSQRPQLFSLKVGRKNKGKI